MKEKINNKEGGFIELIIVIIIALLVMRYFGLTVTGVINWFVTSLRSVFR